MGRLELPNTHDVLPTVDKLTPSYRLIELAGWAGTGTSSTGQRLAELHGARFIGVGDIFRTILDKTSGAKVLDSVDRKQVLDDKINNLGVHIIKNAVFGNRYPVIVDSRVGAVLAHQFEMQNGSDLGILKIKLIATVEKSSERIARREGISMEEAHAKTLRRNEKDAQIFREMLGQKSGADVLDDNIFDFVLDTTDTTVDQNIEIINEWLKARNYLH